MFYEDLNTYYESQTENRRPLPASLQGYVIGFSLLSFSFFLVTLSILHCIRYCPVFYDWYGIRIIMPSVTIFLCVLNATIAYDYASPSDPINYYWGAIVYTLSSAVAPGKSIRSHKFEESTTRRRNNFISCTELFFSRHTHLFYFILSFSSVH